MSKTRKQKEKIIEELVSEFKRAKALTFFDHTGVSTPKLNELKRNARKAGGDLMIARKSLIERALIDSGKQVKLDSISGPIGIVFSFDDEISPIKAVADFLRKNKDLPAKFQGGFIEVFYTASDMQKLAALPGRQELLGQLVYSIASPMQNFVYVLNANLAGLVRVLSAIKK